MPYTVRFNDVDYGNGGSVRTGVLGSYVTKKIANNAARDHFASWSNDFAEYEPCDVGDPYHEEYVDGMIDIDAITPEGLAMRAWVERSASSIKRRKPEGNFTHEYIMKTEDTDYQHPRTAGQDIDYQHPRTGHCDVISNMQGPFETEEEAINACRNHLRSRNTPEITVREYAEEKTTDGMVIISGVAGNVHMKAWVEAREVRVKHAKPASVLSEDATQCPFCGRSAAMFPTGQAGLSRHVRLCPQKINGPNPALAAIAPASVVVPTHEQSSVQQLQQQIPHSIPQQLPQQHLPHTIPQQMPQHLPQQLAQPQVPPGGDQSLTNYLMTAATALAAPSPSFGQPPASYPPIE